MVGFAKRVFKRYLLAFAELQVSAYTPKRVVCLEINNIKLNNSTINTPSVTGQNVTTYKGMNECMNECLMTHEYKQVHGLLGVKGMYININIHKLTKAH